MTPAQRVFLRIVRDFGSNGEGWCEIELQYESRRISDAMPTRLIPSLLKRLADKCEHMGWIVCAADGPTLTEAGAAALVE